MEKIGYILTVFTFSLSITSCGSEESDEIKSGKINACKLKCVTEKYEKDQSNVDLYEKMKEYNELVEINRENESDKDLFDKSVKEYLKEDCICSDKD